MLNLRVIGMESVAVELPCVKVVVALEIVEKPVVTNPETALAPGAQLHAKVPDPN